MVNIVIALRHLRLQAPLSHHPLVTLVTSPIGHTLVPNAEAVAWMVKWSVSSLLFAISMIYDCIHPCHITHWALFAISMIYDVTWCDLCHANGVKGRVTSPCGNVE